MPYDVIVENDANGVARNIATTIVTESGTDKHIPTAGLDQAGARVGSGNPLHVQSSQLIDIVTALLGAAAAGGDAVLAKKQDSIATGTGFPLVMPVGLVRKDTLATITPAVGDWFAALGGPYGEAYVSLATALGNDVDSVLATLAPGHLRAIHKNAEYTATQTGTALWTPASGKIFICTKLFVSWEGSADGRVIIWSSRSGSGDTAYTAGTDQMLVNVPATPTTKGSGGIDRTGFWVGNGANYPLNITTTNGLDVNVAVDGYEV